MHEGDDEIAAAPMTGGGALVRLKRWTLGLAFLSLSALTLFLLAERNHRFYYLSTEGDRLLVSKGAYFPVGKEPYAPADEELAKAYAPIVIPAGFSAPREQRFDERQDLDRHLFDVVAGWAESRIKTDDPVQAQAGFGYVERAARLPGLSTDQAVRLRALQAEVAYFEGKDRLERASALLLEARDKLRLATEASSVRGQDAVRLLDDVEGAVAYTAYALRVARTDRAALARKPPAALPALPTLTDEDAGEPATEQHAEPPATKPVATLPTSKPTDAKATGDTPSVPKGVKREAARAPEPTPTSSATPAPRADTATRPSDSKKAPTPARSGGAPVAEPPVVPTAP